VECLSVRGPVASTNPVLSEITPLVLLLTDCHLWLLEAGVRLSTTHFRVKMKNGAVVSAASGLTTLTQGVCSHVHLPRPL
jgi:hypothetical protein